jgi:type II secretory ATPase GspE/PulE/Tfp pilus assembly ATPase PilB-like protein
MGIEPYLLTSALQGILNQRLVRRLCPACQPGSSDSSSRSPGRGNGSLCSQCAGTGYRGRMLLAELLLLDGPMRQAVLARSDTQGLEEAAGRPGWQTIWETASRAVENGSTTRGEIERVLGPSKSPDHMGTATPTIGSLSSFG